MILLRIALRNLRLHTFKSLVVGLILFAGTALVVVGNAVLDRLDTTMSMAIVNSVSGHLQLYSEDAKDEFEIFKGMDSSTRDVGHITNFAEVRQSIEALDEVAEVVPMGIDYAVVFTGNILDRRLGELREALDAKDSDRAAVIFRHVRRIVSRLREDLKNLKNITDMERLKEDSDGGLEDIEATRGEAFWARFAEAPYEVLEFLENKIAKLAFGEDLVWLNYIGTDTHRFEETFDRFEIVEGQSIPPGQRGFLFNKRIYERYLKNKTARRLDQIKERLDDGMAFDKCDDCSTWVAQNVRQAATLAYQLDDVAEAAVRARLKAELSLETDDIKALLSALLDTDASNFRARYDLFYEAVAPHIILYTIGIGDTLVLTAFSRGGYVRKVPVKVYGTFRFKSLDRSPLAGGFNLTDMMTFRDLYGYMTAERLAEIEAIRESVGVEDVGNAEEAEEALFGGDDAVDELVDETAATRFDATEGLDMHAGGERYTEELYNRVYTQEEIESGVVISAAVMLKPGVDLEAAQAQIDATSKRLGLGVQSTTWRDASGMVGEFIGVIRYVLIGAVFIIFIVALIIINNSMMMSTMERTVEIGTMRAIGAQRRFVRWMILVETGVLTLAFGGGGAAFGAGMVLWMQARGIPAWNDVTYFLFAGPDFRPELLPGHLIIAMGTILVVGIASTLYPAMLATQVTPREAMAAKE